MARVYNSTRLILDPSAIMAARRESANREAEARGARGQIAQGVKALGRALGEGVEQFGVRSGILEDSPDMNDPEYRAAVERFVSTGDLSGVSAYRQRKEDRAARRREMELRQGETNALRERNRLDEEKVRTQTIKGFEIDLEEAQRAYNNAATTAERDAAEMAIKRALNGLEANGVDVSAYGRENAPVGAKETQDGAAEQTATPATLSAKVNDLNKRLFGGFKTEDEKRAFLEEIENLQGTGGIEAESKELSELYKKASGTKSKEQKTAEERAARKKQADKLKALMDTNDEATRYRWQRNDPEGYQKAAKAYEEFYGVK